MIRSVKHHLSVIGAGAALMTALCAAPPAGAVVLNISDNNCEQWVLSLPSGGTQTLTCTALAAPICQVTGAANGVINTPVTLTANCSPGPISTYAWTAAGAAVPACTGTTCQVTSANVGAVAYTVTGTNSAGGGAPGQKSVTWGLTPVATAPSGCNLTLTPSKTPTLIGDSVDLLASCTGGDPVETWTWTGPNIESPTSSTNHQTTILLSSGSVNFTVKGNNAGGSSAVVSRSLTVSTSGTSGTGGTTGGNPTPGTPIAACPGFTNTKVMDVTIPANGTGFTRYYVSTAGVFRNGASPGFGANDAIVVVFKAPATDASFGLGAVHTGDSSQMSSGRTFNLSTKPCDFSYPANIAGGSIWSDQATVMSLNLASGAASRYARYTLVPGQEYYLNIMNQYNGIPGCLTSRCDIYINVANPTP